MKFLACIVAFTLVHTLNAEVVDHFKPALQKEGDHSFGNIDYVYIINLDERPEKYQSCVQQLHPYGIDPYRFSAVNGWQLTQDTLDDVGIRFEEWMKLGHWGTAYLPEYQGEPFHEIMHVIGRTYFSHCMSRGAIGIVLSHLSILQDAYDAGYETIWVMEDDIQLIQDPGTIPALIEKLDHRLGRKNWDILFTDRDTKDQQGNYVPCKGHAWRPNFTPSHPKRFQQRRVISRDFELIGARFGTYSMIIRRSGMKKILDFLKQHHLFLPYDMEFYLPNDIKLFCLREDVVSTIPNALSDNGAPNYQKGRE